MWLVESRFDHGLGYSTWIEGSSKKLEDLDKNIGSKKNKLGQKTRPIF